MKHEITTYTLTISRLTARKLIDLLPDEEEFEMLSQTLDEAQAEAGDSGTSQIDLTIAGVNLP
jgi:hypothetical protein